MRAKLIVLAFSLLFSLGLFEGVLQLHYRLRHTCWLWQERPFLVNFADPVADRRQYTLRPGYAGVGDAGPGTRLAINARGFRGDEVSPWAPVIVTLGDSVPFGWGVNPDQSYAAQLQRLLAASGHAINVVNAGVPSYNLRQSFDRLRFEVLHTYHHPALVTVQAANDILLLTAYQNDYTPDLTWAGSRLQRTDLPTATYSKWACVYYLRLVKARLARKPPPKVVFTPTHPASADPAATPARARMLDNEQAVLDEGLRFCRQQHIPVVLLPIDLFCYQTAHLERNAHLSAYKTLKFASYVQEWVPLAAAFNLRLQQAAASHPGAYFFDTRALLDAGDREGCFVDFIHLTPRGNARVAQGLLDFLRQRQLLR